MTLQNEYEAAAAAVRAAARLTDRVQQTLVDEETVTKGDRSPVTVADYGAQAVVSMTLQEHLGDVAIVGEETTAELGDEQGQALLKQVVELVAGERPGVSHDEVVAAIDHCSDEGGSQGRRWVLDPIDGTKGFLRKGQYAIALALMEDGVPILGILGCPNLAQSQADGDGCLIAAIRGEGTWEEPIDAPSDRRAVSTSSINDTTQANFCESVESGHSKHDDSARVAEILGVTEEPVRMDSQCKYGTIARGDAAIYLRLPTSKEYREKIWDHAAGWIVVQEAGGAVTDVGGRPLDFSLGRKLLNNRGIIATNGKIQQEVLDAVREVLGDAVEL